MDGVDSRDGVYLVGATNRPDIIDPALLRPGRLDKMLYVPLPDLAGRVSILRALLRNKPLVDKIDVGALGMDPRCEGFSGADLAALVREACILALKVQWKLNLLSIVACTLRIWSIFMEIQWVMGCKVCVYSRHSCSSQSTTTYFGCMHSTLPLLDICNRQLFCAALNINSSLYMTRSFFPQNCLLCLPLWALNEFHGRLTAVPIHLLCIQFCDTLLITSYIDY